MKFEKCAVIFSLLILSGCSTSIESKVVQPVQRSDKELSCKELLLEMNEAQYYKKSALNNRGPKIQSVLMPMGYISTYLSAEEAIEASDARVEYLDQIYDILKCS